MLREILNFKSISKLVLIFCGIYLLSFLGYLFPLLNNLIFWAIFFITFALTLKKLEYGVAIILAELFIGAKGYLFSFNFGGFVLSLRIALFTLVFLIWLFQKRKEKFRWADSRFFPAYACLTIFIALGIITAFIYGNSIKNIFFDVNGYFYFAFAFVIFDTLVDSKKIEKILKLLIAGGIAVSLLTLFVSAEFTLFHQDAKPEKTGSLTYEFAEEEEVEKEAKGISHGITAKEELKSSQLAREIQGFWIFRWTKDTGLGEITYIGNGLFRFFTPAQLYTVIATVIILFGLLSQRFKLNLSNFGHVTILALSCCALLIGYSRSLWLGLLASFVFLLFCLPRVMSLKIVAYGLGLVMIFIIITGTVITPVYDIMTDRIASIIYPSEQSSAVNRINLLEPVLKKISEHPFLGSGFGTVIKYKSVVPGHAGILKVFAFEWSYLDTIIEIGILGFLAYLWFLWKIFEGGHEISSRLKTQGSRYLILGLLAALFGLVITNITTPYLNHPLGIGYLLLVCAVLYAFKDAENATNPKA